MLTGNGRHRRPRQAPALVVAAGVTGSAIAIPLLAAASASAADGTVWDKVAECESGGSWSADTGNGHYGGLQLTHEDWEKYGGLDYASNPDLASRSQQIAVAQKILADQGVGAWHTCGLLSGLTEKSGAVDVDTGVADDSSSATGSDSSDSSDSLGLSNSSDSSVSSDSSQHSSDGSSDSSDPPGESSAKSSPSASLSATTDSSAKSDTSPGSGGVQSPDSSPTGASGSDTVKSEQEVGTWSLVDTSALGGGGRHRGAGAEESATDGGTDASGRHAASDTARESYVVRPGDTLASIADSLGLDGGWSELYGANKKAIGADPNRIVPGQRLAVGAQPGEKGA